MTAPLPADLPVFVSKAKRETRPKRSELGFVARGDLWLRMVEDCSTSTAGPASPSGWPGLEVADGRNDTPDEGAGRGHKWTSREPVGCGGCVVRLV